MTEKHEQFKQLKKELSNINTQRGGGPDGMKGFAAEHINATYSNLERIDKGIKAREVVIDDNGNWDSIIKYTSGAVGRPVQDKMGYSYSYYKNKISTSQYDGGVLRINPDNPIFEDKNKFKELKHLANEHGIKIVPGSATEKETKAMAELAEIEGEIRSTLGMSQNAPVVAELYKDAKEIEYNFNRIHEKATEFNDYIYNKTNDFVSENIAQINMAGVQEAESAACLAAAMSIGRNTVLVLKGEEDTDKAVKQGLLDVVEAASVGYVKGAITKVFNLNLSDEACLVNGTIQVSNQIISYLNDDIDENKLVENIVITGAQLSAAYIGRLVGGLIGCVAGTVGIFVGQFVGEMITTAICQNVVSEIQASKELEKRFDKTISLYRNAERQITESQIRLEELIQKENNELIETINSGMEKIKEGIASGSYQQVELGLAIIGEKFGISLEDLQKDKITKENIFDKQAKTIVFE